MTRLCSGQPGFDSSQRQRFFLFATTFRLVLGPTQTSLQWVPGALSPGLKWPEHEGDHSPPSNVDVKRAWVSLSLYLFLN